MSENPPMRLRFVPGADGKPIIVIDRCPTDMPPIDIQVEWATGLLVFTDEIDLPQAAPHGLGDPFTPEQTAILRDIQTGIHRSFRRLTEGLGARGSR